MYSSCFRLIYLLIVTGNTIGMAHLKIKVDGKLEAVWREGLMVW
jgi:hypothetical protein